MELAFTDRFGGVSRGSFGELNLGAGVGDSPQAVSENRSCVAEQLGAASDALWFMRQQHGTQVVRVSGPSPAQGAEPACDALVTDDPGVVLAVLVADCTPVLLFDARAGVVGLAHAGRAGMAAEVALRCVEAMEHAGAQRLQAVVGPSICGRCYEVPEQMRDEAAATWPAASTVSWSGTPALDVAAGVVQQLRHAGAQVQWLPGCTRESPDLFSHRGDPRSGRFAGMVRLRDRMA